MFPFNNGSGMLESLPVVKKRRSRKKASVPLDPETERQERELRLKIQQSLVTQHKSRKEIEEDEAQESDDTIEYPSNLVGGATEQMHHNDNSNFASMFSGKMCIGVNSGMPYPHMGGGRMQQQMQQRQFQYEAPNNQLYGNNYSLCVPISDSGRSEEVGGNLNIAQKMNQIELQFALQRIQLDNELKMREEIEIKRLHTRMRQELEIQKFQARFQSRPFSAQQGPQIFLSNPDEAVIGEKMPFVQHESKGSSQYALPCADQFQQQQDSYQHEYPDFTVAKSRLNWLHQQLQQQTQETIRPQADNVPFELRNHQTHQQQQQQSHLLHPHPYNEKQTDGDRPHNTHENNGQLVNFYDQQLNDQQLDDHQTSQLQQQQQLYQQHYLNETLQQLSASPDTIQENNGQDIRRHATDNQQQIEQKSIHISQKATLHESGRSFSSSLSESWLNGSIDNNYAFNSVVNFPNSCMSFEGSTVDVMDDKPPNPGNDAVERRVNDSRNMSNRNDSSSSGYAGAQSENNKANGIKTNDGGNATTTFMTNFLPSPFERNVVPEYDSFNDIKGSVSSSINDSMLSIDSVMLEDMMKRSFRTFDDGGTGMETNVSNNSDGYKHVFDSSSSFGNKLIGRSFGRASKRSTKSKTSQWTNSNPFEDTEESGNDVHDRNKSARTDKSSSGDDGAQVVIQNKNYGNDAQGDSSATTPFKMNSHTSPTESIVALHPIQENDMSECDSLRESKRSASSTHIESLLSVDSRMMEEIMKRSSQNPDAGASLSDVNFMNASFVTDYKKSVEGAIASLTDDSPISSHNDFSSSGRSRSSKASKQSIMSEISQWTRENPFDDSFDVLKEMEENDMHNSSDRGLTLLSMMSSMMSSISSEPLGDSLPDLSEHPKKKNNHSKES
ncbi:hypothetical protein ACHAXA_003072 [Cyclostephanos tholiformis]|uniref:Uncharacterized protein n=1 Tax=Cyclostephanos tholiformis TaxID=382380 RepID=A0ABD3RBZ7_9STRA